MSAHSLRHTITCWPETGQKPPVANVQEQKLHATGMEMEYMETGIKVHVHPSPHLQMLSMPQLLYVERTPVRQGVLIGSLHLSQAHMRQALGMTSMCSAWPQCPSSPAMSSAPISGINCSLLNSCPAGAGQKGMRPGGAQASRSCFTISHAVSACMQFACKVPDDGSSTSLFRPFQSVPTPDQLSADLMLYGPNSVPMSSLHGPTCARITCACEASPPAAHVNAIKVP